MIIDEIRALLEKEDIPAFGIGPASKMADEPPNHRPGDFLPGTQSLICFGIPLPRDVYRMSRHGSEAVWRSQNLLYRHLDTVSLRLSALMEEYGEKAVPIYGCMPLDMDEKGTIVGYLNQIRAGEVTGVGVIGKNGMLLHSRFGSRLMLGCVLTTAILPAMRFPEIHEPGCPSDCRICADACPPRAILPNSKRVKVMRCLRYTARTPLMSRMKFLLLRAWNTSAAARYMSLTAFDELTFHICSRCVAVCPYGDGGEG